MLCVLSGLLHLKLRPQLFPRIVQHILVTTKACMESAQYKAPISIADLLCRALTLLYRAQALSVNRKPRGHAPAGVPQPCTTSCNLHARQTLQSYYSLLTVERQNPTQLLCPALQRFVFVCQECLLRVCVTDHRLVKTGVLVGV